MKKKLLFTVLFLLVAVTLASCSLLNKDNTDGSDNGNNGNGQSNVTEGTLWKSGDAVSIVAEPGASADVVNELFEKVAEALKTAPTLKPLDSEAVTRELLIGNTGREISNLAYEKLERLEKVEKYDARWLIYCEGGSVAIVYDEDDEDVALGYAAEYFLTRCISEGGVSADTGIVEKRIFNLKDHYQAIDDAETAKKWAELEKVAGNEIVGALKGLYGMYSDEMILWLADLYDPAIGGFYYSNSARDTVGYLPDGDSTYQVLALLQGSGALTDSNQIPERIRNQIVAWIKGLQNKNGYFYHPQWGVALTDIKESRRSRDLTRCVAVLKMFGAQPTYDTPTGVKGDGYLADGTLAPASAMMAPLGESRVCAVSKVIAVESSAAAVPAHLENKDSFEKYLSGLKINKDSYSVGSGIVAQISEIIYRDRVLKEAGADYSLREILINWLDSHQFDNGLWEETVSENSVNGLMKIAGCYSNIGSPIPRAELGARAAIDYIINGEVKGGIVGVFNPWSALSRIQGSLGASENEEDLETASRIRAFVNENAVAAIKQTAKKLVDFQKPDGSYSYTKSTSSSTSPGVPIAVPGSYEGDVNAALIGSNDVVNSIYSALGISEYFVPFYTYTDIKLFSWRLDELDPVIKDENIVGEVATITFDDDAPDAVPSSVDYSTASSIGLINVIEDPREDHNGNVLYFESGSGGKETVTVTSSQLTSSPTRYVFESDFCIESLSGYSVQIFLSNSYMITFRTKGDKVNIVEASSNSEAYAKVQPLKITPDFGEWFNLRVEYYVGDHDTVRIKVYYNYKLMAVTDNYYDKAGGKLTEPGTPAVGYNVVTIQTMSSSSAVMMMDNIEVYSDSVAYKAITDPAKSPAINVDKDDKPIDSDTETVYTFGTASKDGILHDFLGSSGEKVGGASVSDGALKLESYAGRDGFAISNGIGTATYAEGTTYYMEADFTYLGGTPKTTDMNAAFVGLLANDDELKNSKMFAYGYLTFLDGGEAVSLYGARLEKGVTYRIRIEYTVGDGNFDEDDWALRHEYVTACFSFYVNGKKVEELPADFNIGLATQGSDKSFLGFGIYTRGGKFDSLELSMDNVTIGSKAPAEGGGNGPVLPEEDFEFIDSPSYDGIIPDGWLEDND